MAKQIRKYGPLSTPETSSTTESRTTNKKRSTYREPNSHKIDGKKMKGNKKNMYGIGTKEI